jgi:hypothetical protein
MNAPFRFGHHEAKNSENERIRFAKRNEGFRIAGRKPLKSLGAADHDFAGSFVFKGLSAISFRGFLAWGSSDSKSFGAARAGSIRQAPPFLSRPAAVWLDRGMRKDSIAVLKLANCARSFEALIAIPVDMD